MRPIKIFDTTLRDGAQSASAMLKIEDKIAIADQLERLGVDVIEAGFPASSEKESEIVRKIAMKGKVVIAALARTKKEDVKKAWESLSIAKKPRFHIFIASSEEHMEKKLHMKKEEVIKAAFESVEYAKNISNGKAEIEFSAEDATRTDEKFLLELYSEVIKAGAKILNIPDSVGIMLPNEFFGLVSKIRNRFPEVLISVHCHNDLGLAIANSIAAIEAGADQVHCTMNGIGERAGNAALEEIAAIINVRKDKINVFCNINMKEIFKTSEMVSKKFRIEVPHYKAIIGKNATKHEAGIHVQYCEGYEIFKPEDLGMKREIVLGKHSGIHTVFEIAKINRIEINSEEAMRILKAVKENDLKITEREFKEFKSKII